MLNLNEEKENNGGIVIVNHAKTITQNDDIHTPEAVQFDVAT